MSDYFHFVRDYKNIEAFQSLASEHGFMFEQKALERDYDIILVDKKRMPTAFATLKEEGGVFVGYAVTQRSSRYPLITFFQDILGIPVVVGIDNNIDETKSFDELSLTEKVVKRRLLENEIAEGRSDNLADIFLDQLNDFFQNFNGTNTTCHKSSGPRIDKNKERANPL